MPNLFPSWKCRTLSVGRWESVGIDRWVASEVYLVGDGKTLVLQQLYFLDEEMSWRSKTYALSYSGQRGSRKKDPSKDNFLSKHLPQSPSLVLDAGGGNGRWSLGFNELGYKVCLVDFNRYMLKMAKNLLKNTDVHIVLSDIRFLPFRSETFDLVFCEADPI